MAHSVGGGVSAEACQQRFCMLQNSHALRGQFTVEESTALRRAVEEHGDRWSRVCISSFYAMSQKRDPGVFNTHGSHPFQLQPQDRHVLTMSTELS